MNLLKSVNDGDIEKVKELLANEKVNVNATDNHNFTGKLKFLIISSFNS